MIRVTCACIIKDGCVLVAQRSQTMDHSMMWEFPGGKIKPGESPEACVKREILEEMEINIEVIAPMVPVQYKYATMHIELIPFLCRKISGEIKLNEHESFKWIRWKEFKELPFSAADEKLIHEPQNHKILKENLGE